MFAVDYYQNDYALVTIADDGKYLIVPEGESVPEDMDKDITVLQQPIQNIYLAASAAMDMFVATDALDAVRFSSLKADGWYIEEAKKAMEDGDIIYAGKYSAPDYEMILNENCGLADVPGNLMPRQKNCWKNMQLSLPIHLYGKIICGRPCRIHRNCM